MRKSSKETFYELLIVALATVIVIGCLLFIDYVFRSKSENDLNDCKNTTQVYLSTQESNETLNGYDKSLHEKGGNNTWTKGAYKHS